MHGGNACLTCGRLVSVVPSATHDRMTVRCLWTESDVVEDVMTPPDVLVMVSGRLSIGAADEVAEREDIHHLLVGDHDWIEGAICRCDLAAAGSLAGNYAQVGERMTHRLTTVPPG